MIDIGLSNVALDGVIAFERDFVWRINDNEVGLIQLTKSFDVCVGPKWFSEAKNSRKI